MALIISQGPVAIGAASILLLGIDDQAATTQLTITDTEVTLEKPLRLPDGTAGAPSLSFSSDADTGMILSSSRRLTFVRDGVNSFAIDSNNELIIRGLRFSTNPISTTPDIFLVRDAASTLALHNFANAATFNLYNTFTDSSNYERLAINAASAADVQIVPESAGTGTLRGLQFGSAAGRLGFYGTTAIAKPDVTGSRAGNAALADLLIELANLGILTDSSSA